MASSLVLFILLQALTAVTKQACSEDTSFVYSLCKQNGNILPPQVDMDSLLANFTAAAPTAADRSSTSNYSFNPTTMIYGVAQCQPDAVPTDCSTCLDRAKANISTSCESAAIRLNGCLLLYSDQSPSAFDDSEKTEGYPSDNQPTDPADFQERVSGLLGRIISEIGATRTDFMVGVTNDSSEPIYGMVQCIPNLLAQDCVRCLNGTLTALSDCCSGRSGAQLLRWSCNLRYENHQFFSSSLLAVAPPAAHEPTTADPPATHQPTTPAAAAPATQETGHQPTTPAAAAPATQETGEGKNNNKSKTIWIVISVVVAVAAALPIFGICIYRQRKKNKTIRKIPASQLFHFRILKAATNNFSEKNKLGEGGFGPVYKGVLQNGEEIAVKRLSSIVGQGSEEFTNEVQLLSKLQDENLVKLLGCCVKGEEKLLVYEYLPNRSLDQVLFDSIKVLQLPWEIRYTIIEGICRGLIYLHKECGLVIIHRDIKPANILLDEKMNPKISDFGLAKLFGDEKTHKTTKRKYGSDPYMAPEYLSDGRYSTRSDVYSYGVLVLEIVTGQKKSRVEGFLSYVWEHWLDGMQLELKDPTLSGAFPADQVTRCIQIGLLCVQNDRKLRPEVEEVLDMLQNSSYALKNPSVPAFYSGNRNNESAAVTGSSSPSTLGFYSGNMSNEHVALA